MLTIYLIALAVGGTLLIASLIMGHGHAHDGGAGHVGADGAEVDLAVDADADADADAHAHDGFGADLILTFLPVLSLRFWMFFLAFFGLTGATLVMGELVSSALVHGLVSGATGYASGMAVVLGFRRMSATQTDSSLKDADYIGASATVMVALRNGETGKVRLDIKGRQVELLATTEEDQEFEAKQVVMIYGMTPEGKAIITRADQSKN